MTRLLSRGSLPMFLMLAMLAGPLLADAAAQVSVPGTYPTIQAAIDAVLSGTTINVQPGTYPETLFIANTSRSITIRGVGGAAATIVDAAGRGAAAIFMFRATGVITIDGLTFRNGAVPGTNSGGGLVVQESSPTFSNCVFEGNTAYNGGGGALVASNASFTNCKFRNNAARHFGGGLYIVSGSRPVFTACEITGNQSGTGGPGVGNNGAGGGVFSHNSATTIRGGRISGNGSKFAAGGVYHFGAFGSAMMPLVIEDAEIADNVSSQLISTDNPAEGGGLHVEDNAVATLTRVRVLRNRANTGGGLNAYRARIDLVDTIVDSNVAAPTSSAPTTTGFGGGAAISSNNPTAPAWPGGVLTLTRSLVRNNSATLAAGGIGVFGDNYTSVRAAFWMSESVVAGNTSQGQGGGIHISRADATIGNSLIISNTVSGGSLAFGGGLLLGMGAAANITATTIASNVAGLNGGGVFMDGAALQMSGSRIFANTANNPNQFGGGGLFVGPNGSSSGTIDSSIIADNTQYQIFENPCPKTRLTYTNNTITPRPGMTDLYVSGCAPFETLTSIAAFNGLANTSGNNSNLPRFAHFLAAPRQGTSFALAWSVARATSITISGVGTWSAPTGITDVAPSVAVTYTLTAAASAANGGNYGAVTTAVTPVAPPTAAKFVPGDFNGDGVADIALFRPSTGVWYIRGVSQVTWGGGADVPLSGDFDGDRKADVGVFRPSTGQWFIRQTATPVTLQYTFGGGTDMPVPADYDGDGRTDIGVFRPSTNTWYIALSGSGSNIAVAWGGAGDIPVQADYDGDGKADIAIFRPSTGNWYIRPSAPGGTMLQFTFGGSIDTPVPGDYDGDGRSDIAVFRPSANTWYIYGIGTGVSLQYAWGGSGDTPIPGDYDGDGVTDIAVFRRSTGAWYIRQSGAGALASYVWGGAGDLPILRR